MSEDGIRKKLADKLRELKRAIDNLGWYRCEECGKYLLDGLDEIHSYRTKDREVIVCYECLEKCERAMIEEG
ncbi:MAG: hypothetical protein GH150_04715 [Hadesarchaea archaeon]|nr:hypothetical protein [Hadesarchaea archaeon]